MVWDTGIYKAVLLGRNIEIKQNPSDPMINAALHSFIDRNYFQAQLAAIRRIVDNTQSVTGDRGIYSLSSLISEIEDNIGFLTREKYFYLRNIPYEIELMQKIESDFYREQSIKNNSCFFVPPEKSASSTFETHEYFDKLSEKSPNVRSPTDTISLSFFSKHRSLLENTKEIKSYVDKIVAHAATPFSRSVGNFDDIKISLSSVWKVHSEIATVFDSLARLVLGAEYLYLPWERPEFYRFWDTPIIPPGNDQDLRELIETYRKETENWNKVDN